MILEKDDVVLLSNRRMFQHEEARFFLGRTLAREGALIKLEGFSFVRDMSNGHVVKKDEKRVKIMSLASPGYIVYVLPSDTNIEAADIEGGAVDAMLVDGSRPLMNLSERTHCGHF
jgi:hypothetical protein